MGGLQKSGTPVMLFGLESQMIKELNKMDPLLMTIEHIQGKLLMGGVSEMFCVRGSLAEDHDFVCFCNLIA